MSQENFSLTIHGKTFQDVIAQASALVETAREFQAKGQAREVAAAPVEMPKVPKKSKAVAAAPVVEEVQEDMFNDIEGDGEDFDAPVVETPKPAKKAKAITSAEINEACLAYAKVKGRPATLAILSGKFGVKSVLELDAKQYPAVIAALKV